MLIAFILFGKILNFTVNKSPMKQCILYNHKQLKVLITQWDFFLNFKFTFQKYDGLIDLGGPKWNLKYVS